MDRLPTESGDCQVLYERAVNKRPVVYAANTPQLLLIYETDCADSIKRRRRREPPQPRKVTTSLPYRDCQMEGYFSRAEYEFS